ncbi:MULTISPECIES: ATP-dependent nuclease [Pseudomonas]|uniref:AAA family ATPase n=1 Tax=Pseudomonas aegrilactucae TaxID=2854028 RepID=A0A9Q2XHI1_9PSED|nr:AAA family ATPase [Pseudomonas putida]MBC3410163.1 AAA family ATPase [Pseudomonas sp. SWRI51]MBV6287116.1 AAA family ATPase [Pseudomonas aegrilactucae]MDD2076718.1 AAA family ATPase [Pseudomonas putida]WRW01886.1 AAA family ATPase [Pseudomonas putida]HDS1692669.1 AAA family ATPase [Pseudomonas putida]
MHLSVLKLENFRQFGQASHGLEICFNPGVTALVGENDAGKTAVIDAIRYVLQTRDAEYLKLQLEDFYIDDSGAQANTITLRCTLDGLSKAELGAFAEYVTYKNNVGRLHIHWSATRIQGSKLTRRWVDISVRSGENGEGPSLDAGARLLLAAAYLKPLRDAEREMSSGRNSRLSQVLSSFPSIDLGNAFDIATLPSSPLDAEALSIAGMGDYMRYLVNKHSAIVSAENAINHNYLAPLSLAGQPLSSRISFGEGGTEEARLKQILERLELGLLDHASGESRGVYGLGSNNVLFMACELLLLGKEPDGLPLLLVEEPEAHLHPQRQLQLMEFLEKAAKPGDGFRPVQVILTTHSPNLSSKIPIQNLVLMHRGHAFSLAEDQTCLGADDYRFLSRFLDVTKAGLFFAKGLLVVEGDAEAILLPALARRLGRDLTKHGVSVINVGGVGLRRYSKIMQRRDTSKGEISIPTACITDMDVMPDCAPEILGLVDGPTDPKWKSTTRRWKAACDFGTTAAEQEAGMAEHRKKRMASDGQCVRTFVADNWTLEYDLAFSGLAREVHAAAYLALNEEKVDQKTVTRATLLDEAEAAFKLIETTYATKEARCSAVYKLVKKASKTITVQHLIDLIEERFKVKTLDVAGLRGSLSKSVIQAIEYATSGAAVPATGATIGSLVAGKVADSSSSAPIGESEE